MNAVLSRRRVLQGLIALSTVPAFRLAGRVPADDEFPPIRPIIRGPQHHGFGYYDKLEFDPKNRFVLANQVDFEHPTPTAEVTIRVGMVDTADFARIQRMRPGYGYVDLPDPAAAERAPEASGVWRIDMETGRAELVFALAEAAAIDHRGRSLADQWHWFNHLLVSPDSSRFVVLHRRQANTGPHPPPSRPGRPPRVCSPWPWTARTVAIDSPHTGSGRQIHLMDISRIVG